MNRNEVRDKVNNTPQFTHDCEACTFLGRYYGPHYDRGEDVHMDLYYCGPEHCTVIARWGSDGPDYSSGMIFTKGPGLTIPPLVEARRRAEEIGLSCMN